VLEAAVPGPVAVAIGAALAVQIVAGIHQQAPVTPFAGHIRRRNWPAKLEVI
jgi:hypothetical protein